MYYPMSLQKIAGNSSGYIYNIQKWTVVVKQLNWMGE